MIRRCRVQFCDPGLTKNTYRANPAQDIGRTRNHAMSKLRLTFACGPYDRTLALRDGSVQPEGIEINYIASQAPDIFWRMLQFNEFEISEMSLSNYATLVGTGEAPFIAIPVFPSRVSSSSIPKRGSRHRPTSKAGAAEFLNTQ